MSRSSQQMFALLVLALVSTKATAFNLLSSTFARKSVRWVRYQTSATTFQHGTSLSLSSANADFSVSATSQLAQLAKMTVLSIDSGDLDVIRQYASTGYITDATTNPLFVSQVGLKEQQDGEPTVYTKLVNDAVEYAIQNSGSISSEDDKSKVVSLAIDRLAVNLGKAISDIVPGYISTEVDPRLSFDTEASIERGRQIIAMYADMGVPKERILIKLAATWEGIMAAKVLETEGIQCNLTLIFSFVQAVACAQYGIHLISPFPGRILDWNKVKKDRTKCETPDEDEGVIACRQMYNYFKYYNHDTICMPASWRPSRGAGFELDEIQALAGTDRMTIPAPLLEKLAASEEPLEQKLFANVAKESPVDLVGGGQIDEKTFRYLLNMDGCGNDKLAEGIRAFVGETEKLEAVLLAKINSFVTA